MPIQRRLPLLVRLEPDLGIQEAGYLWRSQQVAGSYLFKA
jgi:hypothetical protein